jgi:hypothetical protein
MESRDCSGGQDVDRNIILKLILIVEYEDVASVQLAQHRDQWRTLENIIMKLRD